MKNFEIFEDFMRLGYTEGKRQNNVTDQVLGGLVILRSDYYGSTVHYLQDGSSLFMPWGWIDLFMSFYFHSGNQVLHKNNNHEGEYYEEFLYLFTKLMGILFGGKIDGELFLDTLSDICILKTDKFRKVLKEKHDLSLEPFTYKSRYKTFEI